MVKALWFAAKVAVLIGLSVWVVDQGGYVDIQWADYKFIIHSGVLLLSTVLLLIVILTTYRIIRAFINFPKSLARYHDVTDQKKGYVALTKGLTAVAAGDVQAANLYAKQARKLMKDDTGLPLLLEAQAARMDGREEDAAQSFIALLDNEDAGFLGVRGLLQVALDSGDDEGALRLADKALDSHPKQAWILKISYDLYVRARSWKKAEAILSRLENAKGIEEELAQSDRVALYLAQAQEDIARDYTSDAISWIKKAQALSPDFAPVSILLAKCYVSQKKMRKARGVILKSWKRSPHGALVECWLELDEQSENPDQKTMGRFRWIQKLLKANVDSAIGQRLAGDAACDAQLWGDARGHYERSEALGATVRLYKNWAAMEELAFQALGRGEAQHLAQDEGVIRDLLSRAAMASMDKVWVCRLSGVVYEQWKPIATPHGSFNTIVWDVPEAYVVEFGLSKERVGMISAPTDIPK